MTLAPEFAFDVAITYAGADRNAAQALVDALTAAGVRVFYDKQESAALWGEDLYTSLAEVYSKRARFCIMLISAAYAKSLWTSHERRFAQERAFRENSAYILPIRLDDTTIPGVPDTTAYLDFRSYSVSDIVTLVKRKLERASNVVHSAPPWHEHLRTYATSISTRCQSATGVQQYVPLQLEGWHGAAAGEVDTYLSNWLNATTERLIVILGDYGTGKTTSVLHFANTLATRILQGQYSHIPVVAPLRDVLRFLGAPDILGALRAFVNAPMVGEPVTTVVFLDGYDEVLDIQQRAAFHSVLRQLLSRPDVKIVITARTQFFRTQREVISRFASGVAGELGLVQVEQSIAWLEERTVFLKSFKAADVRQYLGHVFGADASDYYDKLISIYDLEDLAARPILLALIVTILPHVDRNTVMTQADIYRVAINLWVERESWRGVQSDDLLRFAESLAVTMFLTNVLELRFDELSNYVKERFKDRILARVDLDYFDSIVRTSGFLFRDADGNFSFMHRSFQEYLVAAALRKRLEEGTLRVMDDTEFGGESLDLSMLRWDSQPEKELKRRIAMASKKLRVKFRTAHALTDAISDLLAGTLSGSAPTSDVATRLAERVAKRDAFRQAQRELERFGGALQQGRVEEKDLPAQSSFERVMMIGGAGRVYYTVEHYYATLFTTDAGSVDQPWLLVLGYWETWQHT